MGELCDMSYDLMKEAVKVELRSLCQVFQLFGRAEIDGGDNKWAVL